MAKQMKEYIVEQAVCWQRILQEKLIMTEETSGKLQARKPKHLIVFGSGSSYIAGCVAKVFAEKYCGLHTMVLTPSQLYSQMQFYAPEQSLVVAVSQSGKSVTTMEALHWLKLHGYTVIGMTADAESQIANAADGHVLIDCGEEVVGPKTKGMTGTVLALYMLAMELNLDEAERTEIFAQLTKAVTYGMLNQKVAENFFETHKTFFTEAGAMLIIAEEQAYASCLEGALKLLETIYIPVEALELEEYTHGVQNTIEPGLHHILVATNAENAGRMAQLNRFQLEKGCKNICLATVKNYNEADTLQLESTHRDYTLFMELLPVFHVFSAYGSEAKGIDCDHPKFANFYSIMGTKM